RRVPENRGGRPRGECDATDQPGQKILSPKFQLVVKRDSDDWDIFAEVEPIGSPNLRVLQGGDALHEGCESSLFGPLRDLSAPVRILRDDVEVAQIPLITQESPLLFFRLHRDVGRFVRRPSRGLTLAVVPIGWRYDQAKSGAPRIEPELMRTPGYRA